MKTAAPHVTAFYELHPFPGYAPADDAASLLDRCRASHFLDAPDRSIPATARVLDAGCGTGQLANFLALAGPDRRIAGVDLCGASLAAAEGFRAAAGSRNLVFARGDLFRLPAPAARFDVVVSRGVVHHTPDPAAAIASVASHLRPGGLFVLDFYESLGRLPHRGRQLLSRGGRRPVQRLDPILRRRDLDPVKRETWIEDQYRHPLEHCLSASRVQRQLEALGLRWVRSVPPVAESGELFADSARPGAFGFLLRRLGWAWRGLSDPDAGLICLVARRPES